MELFCGLLLCINLCLISYFIGKIKGFHNCTKFVIKELDRSK